MYSIPQYAFLYVVLLSSMLAGASVVHFVVKPDLSLKPDQTPRAMQKDVFVSGTTESASIPSTGIRMESGETAVARPPQLK